MRYPLTMTQRVLLAIFVLLVDLVFFFFPITAAFLAYVIVFNPPGFREFVNRFAA